MMSSKPTFRSDSNTPLANGLQLLRVGIAIALVLAVGMIAWTTEKALSNPDVQTERPSWLDSAETFNVSFWTPLFLTITIGIGLVIFVFVRASNRIKKGEDLYANRLGRNVRRRGEQHLQKNLADDEQL